MTPRDNAAAEAGAAAGDDTAHDGTADSAAHDSYPSLGSRLAEAAGYVENLKRSGNRGRLAELRRLSRSGVPGDTFWTLVQRFGLQQRDQEFWLAVIPLIVRHPHSRDRRPGRVLEASGLSKARFERWLRLDRDRAIREAGRILSHLRDETIDWVALGHALYRWNEGDRYGLARDFFTARAHRNNTSADGAKDAQR